MDPNERKRKAPPLPKFQQPGIKNAQMAEKVTDFLQQISKQATNQSQPNVSQPQTQQANQSGTAPEGQKKKLNLASISSKLNSIMSAKKIDLNKVVQSSKKNTQHQQQAKNRRDIQIQYDPQNPNSYQQAKSHYLEQFQKLKRAKLTKKQDDQDQKISKMIAEFEKSGVQIQQEIIQPIIETHTLDDKQSLALRMMQKHGFKVGEGLGKQSQGIRTPLTIKKLTDSSCRIQPSALSLANFVTLEQTAENALKAFKIQKSKVVALQISMKLSQFTDQIEKQIKEECQKYGEVKQWILLSTNQSIVFFCKYANLQESFKAFTRINGRYYDQKIINVLFYPQQHLDNKNFSQPLHQPIQF